MSSRTTRSARLPLYLGGLMGPFGTVVIVPMFPELREAFGASSAAVSWGFNDLHAPFRCSTPRLGHARRTLGSAPNGSIDIHTFLHRIPRVRHGTEPHSFLDRARVSGRRKCVHHAVAGCRARRGCRASRIRPSRRHLLELSGRRRRSGTRHWRAVAADVNWRWAFVGVAILAAILAAAPPAWRTARRRSTTRIPSTLDQNEC